MRTSFDQKLTVASGLLLLGSIGAGIAGAAHAQGVAARSTAAEIATINRVNKGDRLTTSLIRQAEQKLSPPAQGMKTSLQRPPLGCDPAFSPVADPMRAGIYKRCTV